MPISQHHPSLDGFHLAGRQRLRAVIGGGLIVGVISKLSTYLQKLDFNHREDLNSITRARRVNVAQHCCEHSLASANKH